MSNHLQKKLKDSFVKTIKDVAAMEHGEILKYFEIHLYFAAMEYCGGNQVKASEALGVARGTLRTKLKEYFGTTQVGGAFNYKPKDFMTEKEKTKKPDRKTLLFESVSRSEIDDKCCV
ncbi:MAG: hypothetical protein HRT87_05315 [Legionellales bacterium]|nr:hypothetical protein [Legionellales bacterium]